MIAGCADKATEPEVFLAEETASQQIEGVETTLFDGPGLVCGAGFAIALTSGEQMTRYDRQMDFLTYELVAVGKSAVLYEGSYPMDGAQILMETGADFPSTIAVHLDGGGYSTALADRLLVADNYPSICRETVE